MRSMRPVLVKTALTAAVISALFVWGSFACWPVPEFCGKLMARIDLAHGRYRVLTYGLPVPWQTRYAKILRRRYGVELKVVGGCVISESASDFTDGYDQVSTAAIGLRFGRNALTRAYAEARFSWEVQPLIPMNTADNREDPPPQAVPGAFRSASPSGSAISTRWTAISMLRR